MPANRPAILRSARERLGLTQRQVAEAIGVHPHTYQRWEAGRAKPNHAATVALSVLLNISLADLDGVE